MLSGLLLQPRMLKSLNVITLLSTGDLLLREFEGCAEHSDLDSCGVKIDVSVKDRVSHVSGDLHRAVKKS